MNIGCAEGSPTLEPHREAKEMFMKQSVRVALAALPLCGVLLIDVAGARADDLPKRKPGMWEITVTQEGMPEHAMKQCIDEKTDAKMQQTGVEMAQKMGGSCKKNTLNKTSDGFKGESECTFGATTMTSKSSFTGDFQSAYVGKVETAYNPPFLGKTGSKSDISAKWIGPCTEGLVPGDMVLPNGMKMNIDQMSAMAQRGAAAASNPQVQEMMKSKADIEQLKAQAMKELMKQQQNGGGAPQ